MEEGIRAFLSFLSEKLSKTMEAKGKEQTRGLQEAPGFWECMFGQNSVKENLNDMP